MPTREIQPEHVKCSSEGCKSVFPRPKDAMGGLSTADVAQLNGWTLIDRDKGLLRCHRGHDKE